MGAVLGVSDSKLSASINDACGIKCSHIGVVPEGIRGIRQHFAKLVKGFSAATSDKSQLGLSHSYSRAKVKFNVNKSDNMIIQSIALLDQLDKDVNTFCMRIREWYSYHFPELIKIVPENALYAKVVKLIKNRKEISQDAHFEKLEQILMDSSRAQAVIDASKSSMGMDISPIDLLNIDTFASRVIGLTDYRKELSTYLQSKMSLCAPNLSTLIGDIVGARLIAHAGSLLNLAKHPSSTVQILGAEKALFRALKTKHDTPKYGLIYHASLVGGAQPKNKGKLSRMLAAKASLAIRVDALSETSDSTLGVEQRAKLESRVRNLDEKAARRISGSGKFQPNQEKYTNVSAVHTFNPAVDSTLSSGKRKIKEEVKDESDETETPSAKKQKLDKSATEEGDDKTPKKKKKKKSKDEVKEEAEEEAPKPESEKKKKKKKKEKKADSSDED